MTDQTRHLAADTDLATLPDPGYRGFGTSRVYFYDLDTREEITDHPANGSIPCYWHGMIVWRGAYVDGSLRSLDVIVFDGNGKPRHALVDRASFGGRRVAVKTWHSGAKVWHFLADGDGSEYTEGRDLPEGVPTIQRNYDRAVDGRWYAREQL